MTEVPLVVTEEAASHVAQLGMQQELEQMLDWVRHHVISLLGIRVEMSGRSLPLGVRPCVFIRAHQGHPAENAPPDLVEVDWVGWQFQTFPFEVYTHFTLICRYQPFVADEAA
jgi:hypothetical protein